MEGLWNVLVGLVGCLVPPWLWRLAAVVLWSTRRVSKGICPAFVFFDPVLGRDLEGYTDLTTWWSWSLYRRMLESHAFHHWAYAPFFPPSSYNVPKYIISTLKSKPIFSLIPRPLIQRVYCLQYTESDPRWGWFGSGTETSPSWHSGLCILVRVTSHTLPLFTIPPSHSVFIWQREHAD